MQNLLSSIAAMDNRRRVVAFLGVAAMFSALVFLFNAATTPSMALLYTGLDAGSASEVVASLEQSGTEYELRGESIYVDLSERDSIRMELAGQSLPSGGLQGYELLDKLSGFGTTSQMFDAAYWRAKEGELAKTILAAPSVRSARVHIAIGTNNPFENAIPATASVTLTSSRASLGIDQARAIRFVVASAVPSLLPENVTILDAETGVILAPGDVGDVKNASDDPNNYSSRLKKSVENIIEARMGVGRAVVEVTVELETFTESIVERSFDPEKRVAISTETEESSQSANGSAPANVTIASNLPDGNTTAGEQSNSNNTTTKERVNYEVSETTREHNSLPGTIKKISAAVLLDGILTTNDAGENQWLPRSPEEIEVISNLVKAAIGFDADRGDQLTVSSLEFPAAIAAGSFAEWSPFDLLEVNIIKLVQLGVLGSVSVLLGLFVVRPLLNSSSKIAIPMLSPSNQLLQHAATGEQRIESKTIDPPQVDKLSTLRGLVSERPDDSSKILKKWFESTQASSVVQ